jgi:hypothetical protein
MIRITDMTNVWETVISHLESLGYDRRLQILPNLYDYIDERCPAARVVSDTALDEAYDEGEEKGYDCGYAIGHDHGFSMGYEEGYTVGYDKGWFANE